MPLVVVVVVIVIGSGSGGGSWVVGSGCVCARSVCLFDCVQGDRVSVQGCWVCLCLLKKETKSQVKQWSRLA